MPGEDKELSDQEFMDQFNPTDLDSLFTQGMTEDQKKMVLKFLKSDRVHLWLVSNLRKTMRTVNKHDVILSPVAAIFLFLCSASGLLALLWEILKKYL